MSTNDVNISDYTARSNRIGYMFIIGNYVGSKGRGRISAITPSVVHANDNPIGVLTYRD